MFNQKHAIALINQHLKNINQLADIGIMKTDSRLLIEHNLDVIKSCDYLIDIGPEGGSGGGNLVGKGTPEELAGNAKSHTGRYLKKVLAKGKRAH